MSRKKRKGKEPEPLRVVSGEVSDEAAAEVRREVKIAEVRLKMRNGFYRKRDLWNRLAKRLLWELGG